MIIHLLIKFTSLKKVWKIKWKFLDALLLKIFFKKTYKILFKVLKKLKFLYGLLQVIKEIPQ